ncbi:hypothetical protein GCM10007063_32540 [Lentibacillus kapialis]|uniref:Transcriptional regulator n=1 Tax=Lentibacillus kapialis TaxID=340214 RepID=A0A917V1B9_9BACI|nr:hypothetical protein [Lentibacillus kapialis]GGK07525.1 hypothetical protein GCM10007063_32540 [Lentibacillus kapialis]
MYRIGVIGPNSSVKRILELAKIYNKYMEFIPYPYKEFKDTEDIVLNYNHYVDLWVFSGQIPYMLAKNALGNKENLVYIQHSESGIYQCLLHMAYYQGKFLERVSIDEIAKSHLDQALKQLDFTPNEVFIKTFDTKTEPQELINFHLDHWEKGETEGALTCFEAIYSGLKEAGVPAYRITLTDMEINHTLMILAEKVKTFYFKDTQIGVEIIEIEQFDTIEEKTKDSYNLQYLEIKIKESLLRLCEKLDGSLLEKGNGRYVIFSSRGTIEREMKELKITADQLSIECDTAVSVGIGFGKTVYSAEVNARRAIQQSKEKKERGIIIVQEDGIIRESAGDEKELYYSFRIDDKKLLSKLKQANISLKSLNKIDALIRKMGWNDFTIKDIATHLNWDKRNTQRLIGSLCSVGLAEYIGEESSSTRGRPAKIYQLIQIES